DRFAILDNGNVGIGTTAPTVKLDVNGQLRVGTLSGTASSALCYDASNILTPCTASSSLTGTGINNLVARWTGTSSLSTGVLSDNGTNVGIGNTAAGSKFEIASGQLSVAGGSITSPSYSFVGDLNTGLYSSSGDQLGLV